MKSRLEGEWEADGPRDWEGAEQKVRPPFDNPDPILIETLRRKPCNKDDFPRPCLREWERITRRASPIRLLEPTHHRAAFVSKARKESMRGVSVDGRGMSQDVSHASIGMAQHDIRRRRHENASWGIWGIQPGHR